MTRDTRTHDLPEPELEEIAPINSRDRERACGVGYCTERPEWLATFSDQSWSFYCTAHADEAARDAGFDVDTDAA